MPRFLSFVALVCFASLAFAQSRDQEPRPGGPGTGNPDEHRVPWKFLQNDVLLKEQPFTLYWMPLSLAQTEKSRLMTSATLRAAATRCVGLEIILPERAAVLDKLGVAGKIPAALLTDREGRVIRRTENVRGALAAEDVERMLSSELSARDEAMYKEMIEANQQASAGNNTAAIDLYKKIWDDRCLFPLAGRDAQRALKNLGVTVKEPPPPPPVDLNVQPPAPPKTETSH
jgi:hypothetical protein